MLEIDKARKITEEEKEKLIMAEEEEIDRCIEKASKEGCNSVKLLGLLYNENIIKYRKAGYKVSVGDGLCKRVIIKW